MQLGRNAEYAIKALVELAEQGQTTVAAISRRRGIPRPYAAKVLRRLEAGGLVVAKRGRGGGYRLALPASRIKLHRVVALVQGEPELNRCLFSADGRCWGRGECPIHPVWVRLWQAAVTELKSVSIADLAGVGTAAS